MGQHTNSSRVLGDKLPFEDRLYPPKGVKNTHGVDLKDVWVERTTTNVGTTISTFLNMAFPKFLRAPTPVTDATSFMEGGWSWAWISSTR